VAKTKALLIMSECILATTERFFFSSFQQRKKKGGGRGGSTKIDKKENCVLYTM
jgi:hypothetical protein